jgi:hypothetical protein
MELCVEDRIRAAIKGDGQVDEDDLFCADSNETLSALASIAGELLAMCEPADTEVFMAYVRQHRARWSQDALVRLQRPSAGHA